MNKILPVLQAVWCLVILAGCSSQRLIGKAARKELLSRPPFQAAHVGISLYDAAAGKYLYNYQADKYFTPASNTKLFTLYAGLKYLPDSLPGIYYRETADTFFIFPSADPTLLHPDFKKQPVMDRLKKVTKPVVIVNDAWKAAPYGPGWAWDDYNEDYMPERSSFPVYGNTVKWIQVSQKNTQPELQDSTQLFVFSEPEVDWKVRFREGAGNKTFHVKRRKDENFFEVSQGKEIYKEQLVPFITNGVSSAIELLKDTLQKEIGIQSGVEPAGLSVLHSQPSDSIFRPMMYRSDNFFAEQTLLMASYRKLKVMTDNSLIDTLLQTDLKELPQKPRWVDGSGLSRYNLFTPQDFIWILKKMKDEFGLERMKTILPGSGDGTLANYYQPLKGYLFAKTGTLSGQVAFSGYLITRKSKLIIFSILVGNHQSTGTAIRRGVEKFLVDVWERE